MINITLFLVSIFLVAVYAAFEISYVSSDRINIQDVIPRRRLDFFVKKERQVIISILIGINIFSVLAATTLTHFTQGMGVSSNLAVVASGAVTTLLIVLVGEIFPKSYAISRKMEVINRFNNLIYITYLFFYPAIRIFDYLLKLSFASVKSEKLSLEEEIEKYAEEKGLESEDLLLLKKALKFYDMNAEDIMIPVNRFPFFSVDTPAEEIINRSRKLPYNKVLLYKNSIDNIVGLIHIKDLLLAEGTEIERYLRPYVTVYSDSPVHRIVEEIKSQQTTVAVVINEYGSTVGVVTVENIVRELLKYFEEEEKKDGIYSGDTRINELREMGIDVEEGDYSTLAGYIIDKLGRIPESGEKVVSGNYEFVVIEANEKEVKKVLIKEKNEPGNK